MTSKVKTNLISGAAAVLLAGAGLAAILVWTGVIERQPGTPAASAVVTPSAPDLSSLEWFDVATWDSSGNDDSPPFHIKAEIWRVMWRSLHDSVGNGSFAVDIYNGDGTYFLDLYDTASTPETNFDGPLTGTLGIDAPGDFFLRISTSRKYEVTVQELR